MRKVVYIEFIDPKQTYFDIMDIEEVKNLTLRKLCTSGVFIMEDKEVIKIGEIFNKTNHEQEHYRNITVVPKKAIIKRLEWEIINTPKTKRS